MFELTIWMLYLNNIGWTIQEISLLQIILNLTQAFFEIPSGLFTDKFGPKKSIIYGQIMIMIYSISYLFARQKLILYLGFFVFGLGLTLISGADQALLYSYSKNKKIHYSEIIGKYNSLAIIGGALSGIVGGMIAEFSWNMVFISTFIAQSIVLLVIFTLPNTSIQTNHTGPSIGKQLITFFRQKTSVKFLVLSIGLSQSIISVLNQYGSLFLSQYITSISEISLIFLLISLLSAGLSAKLDQILKVIHINTLIKNTMLIGISSFVGLFYDNKFSSVILFIIIMSIFELWDTSQNTVLHDDIPNEIRASVISVANLITALLMTLESTLISSLSNVMQFDHMYASLGFIFLISALLLNNKSHNN